MNDSNICGMMFDSVGGDSLSFSMKSFKSF